MAVKFPFRVKAITQTAGNANPYDIVETPAVDGYRTFTQATADGDLPTGSQVYYLVVDTTVDNNVKLMEYGLGTWNNVTKQLSRDQVLQPSTGAIDWGSNWKDVLIVDPLAGYLVPSENLHDLVNVTTARSNLGLGTAAVKNTGTASGDIPLLTTDGLPAVGGKALTTLPAILPAPTGTKMLFYQAAAPTGWTIDTSAGLHDKLVGCTDGAGGRPAGGSTYDVGGWDNSWGISPTIAEHGLTVSEVPGGTGSGATTAYQRLSTFGSMSVVNHGHPGSTVTSSSQWRPPAAYCLVCTKSAP